MLSSEQRRFLEDSTLRYMENVALAEAYLAGRGIGLEFAESVGLGVVAEPMEGHESYVGRLCIPYITIKGPVALTFRCIRDHDCKQVTNHSKYLKPPGTRAHLYGVMTVPDADDYICVTEGEMDALTLHSLGVPALGAPGAKAWQPHWTAILQDFSRVYVMSDGDQAGQEFADRVMMEYDRTVNVPMPDGLDVNSTMLAHGGQFLIDRIKGEK